MTIRYARQWRLSHRLRHARRGPDRSPALHVDAHLDRRARRGAARRPLLPPARVVRARDPLRPARRRPVGPARSRPAEHGRRGGAATRSPSSMPPARNGSRSLRGRARVRSPSSSRCSVPNVCLRSCSATPYARLVADDDYPEGLPAELIEGFLRDNPDPDSQWEIDGADDVALLAPSLERRRALPRVDATRPRTGARARRNARAYLDDDDWRRRPRAAPAGHGPDARAAPRPQPCSRPAGWVATSPSTSRARSSSWCPGGDQIAVERRRATCCSTRSRSS